MHTLVLFAAAETEILVQKHNLQKGCAGINHGWTSHCISVLFCLFQSLTIHIFKNCSDRKTFADLYLWNAGLQS